MTRPLFIALPFLRSYLPQNAFKISTPDDVSISPHWAGALRLWPGLGHVSDHGRFCPENYPFSPQEGAACLADLRQMGEVALSGVPMGAFGGGNTRAVRRSSEMALLEGLHRADGDVVAACAAETARKELIERQQAQKILIWAWEQEEHLLELADIAENFRRTAGSLATVLGAEPDTGMGGAEVETLTSDLVRLDTPMALDASLVPPWRLVTANAMYFLPPEAVIAVEGNMRDDLLEMLDFEPAPEWAWALDEGVVSGITRSGIEILKARAPVWRLLGHTRATGQAPLDAEREWIAWRVRP